MKTNSEKYQNAFNVLQVSRDIHSEVKQMDRKSSVKFIPRQAVAACLAMVLVLGSFSAVYAANVGGIQRTIQVWIHGDQTMAELNVSEEGNYQLKYKNENGEMREQAGGGVAFNEDGTERPLTEDEIKEHLNEPDVEYKDDGSVWVYYMNQKLEITDMFNKDGYCFVKLRYEKSTMFLTIKYKCGYASSDDKFIQPDEFDCGVMPAN